MAKVRVVQTPGSYRLPPPKQASRKPATPAKSPLQKTKKGGVGRPTLKKARKPRKPVRERVGYTEEDILEAVRLVREEDYAIKAAARQRCLTKDVS